VAVAIDMAPPPAASAELAVGAEDGAEGSVAGELDEEEEYKNAPSLAAIEAELKPKVLETFVRHDVLPRALCPRRVRAELEAPAH
jgi:hypothetical protein